MSSQPPSLQEHFRGSGPKRILALDGGGIRGLLSLGFLQQIEAILRARHGDDPDFRLCDYFDLIAGTSTGSIIASLLAQGWLVEEVIEVYRELAEEVFARRWWDPRLGLLRPRYQPQRLANLLRRTFGPECRIGDAHALRTGLLVMCKRIDTGSAWPISNNPEGRYFLPKPGRGTVANRDYPLWQVVRASTAAPTFFKPQEITITAPLHGAQKPLEGKFIDGGVSPYNNPSFQAYLLATLKGFGLQWPTGQDQLLIISVGTGRNPVARRPGWIAALQGITALQSLMDDCSSLVESLMQGMGHGLTPPRMIDEEVGTLSPHELVAEPRFSYARYDVKLYREPNPRDGVRDDPCLDAAGLSNAQLGLMQRMDNAKPKELLLRLGQAAGERKVLAEHFPGAFDLPSAGGRGPGAGERKRYRQKGGHQVSAIRLNLDLQSFAYRKWGAMQTGKPGDWLVESDGSVHTVDAHSFARTYRQVGPGRYEKHTTVWAEPAARAGWIRTLEGETHYEAGDYLVWNDAQGSDGYAIQRARFEELYEPLGEG